MVNIYSLGKYFETRLAHVQGLCHLKYISVITVFMNQKQLVQ